MAKIERFQDLEAWKMARKITKDIYSKMNLTGILRFVIRFAGQQFQSFQILLKDLKEMEIKNFCNFFRLQKLPVQRFMLSFMWH